MNTVRKLVLGRPYLARHEDNRMSSEGDVAEARRRFLESRFRNLDYLLRSRYEWMNQWLNPGEVIIEIGAGAGFSELYLNSKPTLTDAATHPWIERYIDATNMGLSDDSVDVFIASHTVHHFFSPFKFFKECERALKPNGRIIISEINTSLCMRVLLRLMRHEGWSYDVDVFDPVAIVNDPADLWSANCAVPELLFHDEKRFEETFPQLSIIHNKCCEFLLFPISGGVIAKTAVPELPGWMLNSVLQIDQLLTGVAPNLFALGRQVVLKKV